MKKINLLLLAFAVATLSGCSVVSGIFKAGAYTAIIGIVIVVLLIIWLISAFRGRS
ncbi:MAG: lipoprotein [Bacteroidota bacterium]